MKTSMGASHLHKPQQRLSLITPAGGVGGSLPAVVFLPCFQVHMGLHNYAWWKQPWGHLSHCNVRPKPNYHIDTKETALAAILFPLSAEQGPLLDSLHKCRAVCASSHSEERWWLLRGTTAAALISPLFQNLFVSWPLLAVPACVLHLNAASPAK